MTDRHPTSDAQTLWYRLEVAARVIKEFKPETKSLELARFLADIRAAVDGDLLEDEITGKLMRFAPGQGRLLTALLSSQAGEEAADDTTELATARETLERIGYCADDQTWRADQDTQQHMDFLRIEGVNDRAELATVRKELAKLKAHLARAAQPGTVAELTELLVTTSGEWDDNTGDDEGPTSRPYLEHLARAVALWQPVSSPEGGDSEGGCWCARTGGARVRHVPGATGCVIDPATLTGEDRADYDAYVLLRAREAAEGGDSTALPPFVLLPALGDPDVTYQWSEDGEPEPGTESVGWSMTSGCRVNFGQHDDGGYLFHLSLFGDVLKRGVEQRTVTAEQMRSFARQLLALLPPEGGDAPGYFVGPDAFDDTVLWRGTGPDDPTCRVVASKGELDGLDRVLWSAAVKQLTGQDAPDTAGGAR